MDKGAPELLQVEMEWKPKELQGPQDTAREKAAKGGSERIVWKNEQCSSIFIQSGPENTITINLCLENK